MVISGISPAFPRLTDLLGIPPPLHIVRNKKQCISKRLVAKDRKRLLCLARPMLDTAYLFLKCSGFQMCCYVHMDVVPGAYVRELVVFDESLTFLDPLFFAAREFNKHIIQT